MTTQPTLAARLQEQGKSFFRRRAVRYTLGSLAVLFLLFGLMGYFWLPGFAKAKLESLLSEEFARTVRIEGIEISPYTLSATIRGFSVAEAGAAPGPEGAKPENTLLRFDSLYVDLSSTSLARGIPVVSEVRLAGPRLHLAREASGRLNVSDLLDKWLAGPSKPTPSFSVANITLEGGALVFDDLQQQTQQTVTDISLGIPFLANTAGTVDSDVQPRFSAKVNGAAVSLAGKIRPFAPGQDAALELSLKDFDLMRVYQYAPPGLPARLEAARLDTRLEIAFSRTGGKEAKVRLSGQTVLHGVAVARTLPTGGVVRLKLGSAVLDLAEASLAGTVKAALALEDFSVTRDGTKEPVLGFAALELKGVQVSTQERQASVDGVLLRKPYGVARRLAGGELDLAGLLAGLDKAPAQDKAAKAPHTKAPADKTHADKAAPKAEKAEAKGPWKWKLARLAIAEGSLHFADDTLPKARPLAAQGLTLQLDGLSSAAEAARLDFSTRLNDQGSAKIKGTVQLSPVQAELDLALDQVDLVALQGWATENLNALLTRGDVSVKGHLQVAGGEASFKGDVALLDFSVLDKLNSADLLRWRSLKLTGVDAGSAPLRFGVDEINIASFFVRALLTPEGNLNLQNVVKQPPGAAPAAGPPPADAAAAPATAPAPVQIVALDSASAKAAPAKPGPAIRIGRIVLSGGNVNFTDHFVKPNYTANLTDLNGRIGALIAGTLTELNIKGKVDRTAPLEISGKIDPLGKPLSLDIKATAKGVELSGMSPYSGRYVGYVIEKGKLSVDLRYVVNKGELTAENQVFLDQLTFGSKVDSPNALSIPVTLVVALLKNSRGEIDINLPIKGSLNDPQFSLGGIIVKVIMNLLVKAATSPFSLLASLFGGGEELSYVAFEPGRASVPAAAEKPLQTLAKALADRPGLRLELTGYADPEVEKDGLKRAMLERRVKALKATELARKGKASGSVAELALTPEEYLRYLEQVYKAGDFKKPRNLVGMAKKLPQEEMEALLLANMETSGDDLKRLAKERGIVVQAWLVEKGGIGQERVFLMAPKVGGGAPKGAPNGGRVDFSLR